MGELHSILRNGKNLAEPLTVGQREVLERAVAKVVLIGEQVGVSAGEMILLLQSGLTVAELLEYLAVKNSGMS